jgi:predicted transcriptional regulator of viral defense system
VTRAEQRILDLVNRNGLVRARDVKSRGIPTIYLTRMVQKGTLERIARGLYTRPDTAFSEHVSLAEVATLIPHGVLCLLSALQLHELTTQMPQAIWLALPAPARNPAVANVKLEIVRMSEASLKAGVTTRVIDGVPVKVFDPSKTVADLFKYRSRVGLDVALEALKAYWHSGHRDLKALHRYARIDRVERVMRPHLETLAA